MTEKHLVLISTLFNQERTAMDAMREAERNSNIRIGEGAVYTMLKRLEADGLVRSTYRGDPEQRRGGARRRYYALTGTGARALTDAFEGMSRSMGGAHAQ
ncbi:MAG: helix-turn-helix transcriptional regulator [Planctomycetota bacterium]